MIYDLVIIGNGPAGLTAAIYAARANMKVVVIGNGLEGGQIATTSEVANYPGYKFISGPDLAKEMYEQAKGFGAEFIQDTINDVNFLEDIKQIFGISNNYEARSVIIATGAKPRKLNIPGEFEFTGNGVGYCATCDGRFFTGLEVYCIGAGYSAAEEAMYLTKFAKKVIIIAREPEFTCAKSIADKVKNHPKIEVLFNTEMLEINGTDSIKSAVLKNVITGKTWSVKADEKDETFGVFMFIGYMPQSEIFRGKIPMTDAGYIITNENMETEIEGVYAAGDLRPKLLKQVVTAVADGAIAVTSSEHYINNKFGSIIGIEENHKDITKEKKTMNEKKSDLLTDDIREQLRGIFSKLSTKITLATVVDETNAKSLELNDLLEDVYLLSDKIDLISYKKNENLDFEKQIHADKYPVVAFLDSKGTYSGIKYHGIPGGHELNSFVLAIYNLAGPGQPISDEMTLKITDIKEKVNIKIGVSLSCHHCPEVVTNSQRIASLNKNIEAEMIDLSIYEDIRSKFNIKSVPALIINDSKVYFGSKNIDEILELIKEN